MANGFCSFNLMIVSLNGQKTADYQYGWRTRYGRPPTSNRTCATSHVQKAVEPTTSAPCYTLLVFQRVNDMKIRRGIVPVLGVSALVVPVLGMIGTKAGWWKYELAFVLLGTGWIVGVIAVVSAIASLLVAFVRSRKNKGRVPRRVYLVNIFGGSLGLLVVAFVLQLFLAGLKYPLLYDITTDVADPPIFSATAVELRGTTSNPLVYTDQMAQVQRESYPDLVPFKHASQSVDTSFDIAVQIAQAKNWEIISTNRANGTIEAVATTYWYGFNDDVVVRVRAHSNGEGSVLDLRSASRVGVADMGTNARRIREFLSEFAEHSD